MISAINGEYGSIEFSPVHYFSQPISRAEYIALINIADVGVISSEREAIGLECMEFIVYQSANNAVILLSEFTGIAESLPAALLTNPWNYLVRIFFVTILLFIY